MNDVKPVFCYGEPIVKFESDLPTLIRENDRQTEAEMKGV